ncbi:hypothetical protein PQ455_12945 [Sphingomonas naphthae]|uniref:Rod shape-determining protein MreD n=1 Tax=Sphingomonas naphthae TaxID=1813468 RepID=A0ABY7TJP9_9SPHN|nr:hypothetical protein [Sphingomonas naphthae]WCT72539.1 hypothetical protein PQ455_12945 [Sphingomonas naphthae]
MASHLAFLSLRVVYDLTLALACGYAIVRGGRDERLGAAIMIVGSVLTVVAEYQGGKGWWNTRTGVIATDVAVFVAFLVLTLRSNRFWPIWVSALQLIAVATHLAIAIRPFDLRPETIPIVRPLLQAYAIALGFWAYPMLALIVLGAHRQHRRANPRSRSPG